MNLTIDNVFSQCAALQATLGTLQTVHIPVSLDFKSESQDPLFGKVYEDLIVSGELAYVPAHELHIDMHFGRGIVFGWAFASLSGTLSGVDDIETDGGPGGAVPVPAVHVSVSAGGLGHVPATGVDVPVFPGGVGWVKPRVSIESTENFNVKAYGQVDGDVFPVAFPASVPLSKVKLDFGTPYVSSLRSRWKPLV
jgi:hypothetical protein